MDYNLVVIMGRLATPVEFRTFESGLVKARLLLVVTNDDRTDIIPVTYWPSPEKADELADTPTGTRIWMTGHIRRVFTPKGGKRHISLDIVAEDVTRATNQPQEAR